MSVRHANGFLKKVESRGGLTFGSVQRLEFSLGRTGRAKEGQIHPIGPGLVGHCVMVVAPHWLLYIMTMHQGP